ncbi:hypothetical protein EBQ90_00310, partial [bacterium]|nr:hypothetical protein [bacterium]
GDSDSYRIERSLRFNSADDAYLNRTPASAGNRKTWTWSGWVKKCKNEAFQQIFSNLTAANSNGFIFRFDNDDTLAFGNFTSAYTAARETNRVFRDNSSWYHIVATWDTTNATASDRIKIYINGIEETSFKTTTNPSLNADGFINNTNLHAIGRAGSVAGSYFDGYLAEINFIDGQALTPSSFGETDAITGRWKAKAYSGTYGTNGFYLKFADNSGTTATTLGKDSSGNGNNWTPNNFSVTAGAGNDSLVDSPTNYGTDTGLGGEVRGNYATLNPLTGNSPLVDGNLRPTANTAISTIGMSSKKWYAEMNVVIEGTIAEFGIHTGKTFNTYVGTTVDGYGYSSSGDKRTNNVGSAYGASYTSGDIIGCAFDADAGTLVFYKNNVSQGTAFTGLTNGPYFFAAYGRSVSAANNVYVNFGQRPFAYTAPSGFKALCTTNLPTPVIKKPSSAMDVVTYT